MLEFEPDFERRSSFGDAGWADHTVPDVLRHLRVHADILIISGRSPTQAGQLTLAFKHGVATLDGGSTVWITLAERFLIDNYEPVWNVCLEGFWQA